MFCELDVVRFSAPEGGVAVVGEDAAWVPLAIADTKSIRGLAKASGIV